MSQQFSMVDYATSTGVVKALRLHETRDIGGEIYEWGDIDDAALGIDDIAARARLLAASQKAFERTELGLA